MMHIPGLVGPARQDGDYSPLPSLLSTKILGFGKKGLALEQSVALIRVLSWRARLSLHIGYPSLRGGLINLVPDSSFPFTPKTPEKGTKVFQPAS